MRLIEPSYSIWGECPTGISDSLKWMERAGRVCYRSENKIKKGSAEPFINDKIKRGHLSVLETSNLVVRKLLTNQFTPLPTPYLRSGVWEGCVYIGGNIRAWLEGLQSRENAPTSIPELFKAIYDDNWTIVTDPKEIPWELKRVSVRITNNRIFTHEIIRHRPASYLQECIAGDEIVQSFNGKRKWSMKRLYELFTTPNCGVARNTIRIRTKNKDNEIVPSKIISVNKSGVKKIFKIKTINGRELKTSEEHIYFTEDGEKRLKDIKIGERIWVNGREVSREWLQEEYITKNRQRKDIAAEIGMSDCWLGKLIKTYGIRKPKSAYPNRKPGHGNAGMHSSEEKKRISKRMTGNKNHRWIGDDIKDGHGRANVIYDLAGVKCRCGADAVERHHIDRDSVNNHPSNIEFCCIKCHKARHLLGVKISFLDTVVSIEECGSSMTYDLEVDHPAHNFVVNGFVVHNSQRYVAYNGSDVVFICPPWYYELSKFQQYLYRSYLKGVEKEYNRLRSRGMIPQQARSALNNDVAANIVITADLPEWEHIFSLRAHRAADPSMKKVMYPLKHDFQKLGFTR